ncbi:MAG: hypothetical protein CVV64_16455 [Candidatus Wallbacteria bacterium HGW-Wallbacteria-1]|jgi:hypothetical protein|uniref:Glycosyltransferase RgtA/B/C/D-like domain-containing protein n=1 Tax=Candidatus Wallbacteria bacterium HGW-Wallbacteria-1 TaxID=2013854 RepID=A0A2N1PKV6_9BACT|nr:MAG: hypothetical protein CVV64_16455 [Candidatus Wallbacteria bacterium HGW-Wallbacteria-1]
MNPHITVMDCRLIELERAFHGYKFFGVPLLSATPQSLTSAGLGDDPGSYYFVSLLATHLNMGLGPAIDLFYHALIAIGFIFGLIGVFAAYRQNSCRIVGFLYLYRIASLALETGDVYIAFSFAALSVIPLSLYFFADLDGEKRVSSLKLLIPFMILSGLIIAIANSIRSHSGTGVLIFVLVLILSRGYFSRLRRSGLVITLFLGVLAVNLFFSHQISVRDAFLSKENPGCSRISSTAPFWHIAYLGLGYLKNEYVDEAAIARVREIAPDAAYLSEEYGNVLKREVLGKLFNEPLEVGRVVFSKMLVVIDYFFIFCNFGLMFILLTKCNRPLEAAFILSLAFNSLFVIISIPRVRYLLGFASIASIYAFVKINQYIMTRKRDDSAELLQESLQPVIIE